VGKHGLADSNLLVSSVFEHLVHVSHAFENVGFGSPAGPKLKTVKGLMPVVCFSIDVLSIVPY
jgi:hypothetical protein